jgi:uncharacterized protein
LLKSDLEIPNNITKFIALYLLFSIGFKGGQELAHSKFDLEIVYGLGFGLLIASIIPLYSFFIAKIKMTVSDAGAVAAAYGSVSAVTFLAANSFIENQGMHSSGYMVAVLALMEAPAIIMGVLLIRKFEVTEEKRSSVRGIIKHSFVNGSVLMIVGSLVIGFVADAKQAVDFKPFTSDIFKGFLAIFLLEMGMVTAKRIKAFKQYGLFAAAFAVFVPFLNGCMAAALSGLFLTNQADRFIFAILAASASYIAVPAAMRLAAPKADPGLYIPMALGITFPFNITIGMPIYLWVVQSF